MKTKYVLYVVLFFCCNLFHQTTQAQSNQREIGLRMNNLEDFGFIYKKQKSDNKFIRYRLGIANINVQNDIFSLSLGLAVGIEKRRPIAEKLSFLHGWAPQLIINIIANDGGTTIVTPGIGYVLGFQYNFSDSFYLSIESIPNLSASFVLGEGSGNYSVGAGFNSNAVALSAIYCFRKE